MRWRKRYRSIGITTCGKKTNADQRLFTWTSNDFGRSARSGTTRMINPEIPDSARGTAFTILQHSRQKEGFASDLIDQQLQISPLTGPDRGLVTQLVFGV